MWFKEKFCESLKSLEDQHLLRKLKLSEGISFCHNDYLGLSTRPELKEAVKDACDIYGVGSQGSRLLGGHSSAFERAESAIAEFFQSPAALLFSSGYMANLGVVQVLSELAPFVYSDEKNHASLIDGLRFTQREKAVVPHGTWNSIVSPRKNALFLCESLYSMDGTTADLPVLTSLVQKTNGFLLVDEAHAAGVFKESGRGLCDGISLNWDQHARVIAFGKAFGIQGAAVLCSKELRELLINRARTFIYSTAPSPLLVHALETGLTLVSESQILREDLWERARMVRAALKKHVPSAGSRWEGFSPIIPVLVGSEEKALLLQENMRQIGVDVRAIRYPTVRKGSERLRISLNLHVSRENTEAMCEALLAQLERN